MIENVRQFPRLVKPGPEKKEPGKQKKVNKDRLVNKLNYINFQNDTILINFKHIKYGHSISCRAKPLPCMGDELACEWEESPGLYQELKLYEFQDILVPDGQKLIHAKPELVSISEEGIRFLLPDECTEISDRNSGRHMCHDIDVQLIQNSIVFIGSLIDFSTVSFRIELTAQPLQTFQWINPDNTVNFVFSKDKEALYSGEGRILKQTGGQKTQSFVIEPINQQIQRFKPKEFRSTRQELVPSPNAIFRHPFTKKLISLKVFDISGSGFSVDESRDDTVLLPGLIIPDLELNFASSFKIKCKSQVIYKNIIRDGENGDRAKCGLAMLDINVEDHNKLLSLLHQAQDGHSYIGNTIDLDELWDFFFETGFIYPKKYASFESNKEKIKETYEKLYTQNPKIARHFIYQDDGRILGHLAMLRFYENAWMIHHLAARSSDSARAGVSVLNQIGRFINESHRIYSIPMDFVFCYYRPNNRFPHRVFGGAVKNIRNPKECSLDTFAYLWFRKTLDNQLSLNRPWHLTEARPHDLAELESVYENSSGGLMLSALELEPKSDAIDDISEEYQMLGFKRERHLFALKKDANLKAILMVNVSDVGLNLSDLTNCISVLVVDPDELSTDTLFSAISELSKKYAHNEIPVLLYPVSYAEDRSLPYDKQYNLWVLSMQYTDDYFKYLKRLLGKIKH
ncbi:MAG: PilZ domain-containing protein [Pseudomonadota bacterium]